MKNFVAIFLFFVLPFIAIGQTTPIETNDASHKTYEQEKQSTHKSDRMDDVLILLDGKKISKKKMNKINPDTIEEVHVIKDDSEIKKLGYKSEKIEGIISITTKGK